MKKYLQITIIAAIVALSAGVLWHSQSAAALIGSSSKNAACGGINVDQNTNACSSQGAGSLNGLLTVVINIMSAIVGVAAVIMIIVGGLTYVTSGGEASKAESGRNMVLYAIIGLVIVVFAQVLVHFVINKSVTAASGSTGDVLLLEY